jgi:hypothetical protein
MDLNNWCISKLFTIKKIPKNFTQNPSFAIYMQNFKLCEMYYFVTNIFDIFKKIIILNLKIK